MLSTLLNRDARLLHDYRGIYMTIPLYIPYGDWLFTTVLQTVPTYWLETANINYLLHLQVTNLGAV